MDEGKKRIGTPITMKQAVQIAKENAERFQKMLDEQRNRDAEIFRQENLCPHCGQCSWDNDIAEEIPKFIWLLAPTSWDTGAYWSVNQIKIEFDRVPDSPDKKVFATYVSYDGGSERETIAAFGSTMHDALRSLRSKIEKCADPEWVKPDTPLYDKGYRTLFKYNEKDNAYSSPITWTKDNTCL